MTMKREIERKFLLRGGYGHKRLRYLAQKVSLLQTYYLDRSNRLRLEVPDWKYQLERAGSLGSDEDFGLPEWTLTTKSDFLGGGSTMIRDERIAVVDPSVAFDLIANKVVLPNPVTKLRYTILTRGLNWEVDVYISPHRCDATVEVEFATVDDAFRLVTGIKDAPTFVHWEAGDIGNKDGFSNWNMSKWLNPSNFPVENALELFDKAFYAVEQEEQIDGV